MTSSGCHSVKVLSTMIGYFLVAVVTGLCRLLTYDSVGVGSGGGGGGGGGGQATYPLIPPIIHPHFPSIPMCNSKN